MSTSVSAWCEMMDQFLSELEKVFPDEPGIKKYHSAYELVKKANPRKCVEGYMAGCTPYSNYVMQKDEAFFLEYSDSIDFLKSMNIKKHWTSDLSLNTKDAIWQYLQTLFILGTTITNIPPEALNMIEDVANKCASQMQEGGGDEKALMSGMSGLFSSLGNMLNETNKKN